MHFPRGRIPTDVLATWNGCPADVLAEELFKIFSKSRLAQGGPQTPVLRRLYADEVIMVDGRTMEVHELVQNANFETMFGSLSNDLGKLWMTVAQREAFCKEHFDKLHKGGYATFFLHKMDEAQSATPENLLVADVRVGPGGLDVPVLRFENDFVWRAGYRHRVVAPLN